MNRHFFSLIAAILLVVPSFACTSAIFTGKATPDGRPLLWKHRDTGELNNRIDYYPAGGDIIYSFIGLVNSPVGKGEIWTGTNSEGFSIMNTASYNLQSVKSDIVDREGTVMYKALATCRNLSDFEKMLDNMPRPIGVEANFGVIDAEGGAAYYEVNNTDWVKFDVNDPDVAPDGYMVYTNFSNSGRENKGSGYMRYQTASAIFSEAYEKGTEITPQWIFNNLSRSYRHDFLGIDLSKDENAAPKGWFTDSDFIPRRITSASIVVKGVKKGENPDLTVMWTVLGYPPCSVAVPLFVKGGEQMPSYMTSNDPKGNSKLCDIALSRREEIFSVHRGNGNNYFNFGKVKEYMEMLSPVENEIFSKFVPFMEKQYGKGSLNVKQLVRYYESLPSIVQ